MTENIKQNGKEPAELSFQRRATQPMSGGIYQWWFGRDIDESEIYPWWSPQRDNDLRYFWKREGNDILQGAISSLVKWGKTMPWVLEGPKRSIPKYQEMLAQSELGAGWSDLISKTLVDYYTQDKGATWELIGEGEADGPLKGPVLGIAHLDSQYVQPTGDAVYPILFANPKDNHTHKIHTTRVVRIVDMPDPDESKLGIGFCAVSRVIASSQILLKLSRYKNEKLSDLPEAGLLLLNNILPGQWDDVHAEHERGRRKLGHQVWNQVMTLFSIDPEKEAKATFVSFANLPEGFDEQQAISTYINMVALAFGVDAREFWPVSSGSMGTGKETEVMALKARGKGKGDIISAIERAINWYTLPENIHFSFDAQDDDEDKRRAEINATKVSTIMSMWKPESKAQEIEPVVSALEIRQMLADEVDYFKEEFLEVDITEEEEVTDTEREEKWKIDNKGSLGLPQKRFKSFDLVMQKVEKNFRDGKISLDQLIDYRRTVLEDEKYNACHNQSDGRFCSTGALASGEGVINVPRKTPQAEYRRATGYASADKLDDELRAAYNLPDNCKKWPPDACDSIRSYTEEYYADINYALRQGNPIEEGSIVGRNIEGLDEAFKRAPNVPENLIVNRGIPSSVIAGLNKGDVFQDKGFVSTTISPKTQFGNTQVEIRVPKGSKGIYVASISAYDTEYELLLNRGTKFRVVDTNPPGNAHMILEVVL